MAIDQQKARIEGQFEYQGRWVDKKHFRAFVYSEIEKKLAESYEEYQRLVGSGLWFSTKEEVILSKKDKENAEKMQKVEEKSSNIENKNEIQQKIDKKPSKFNRAR